MPAHVKYKIIGFYVLSTLRSNAVSIGELECFIVEKYYVVIRLNLNDFILGVVHIILKFSN